VALVAGADPDVAARLAISMIALQVSIGALNDLIDAPADQAAMRADKPIPAGLVGRPTGWGVALAAAAIGLLLAAVSGTVLLALALVVLAIGFVYDLRLKGTEWSWLPFAIGIPLLPVYGWIGATGALPYTFIILVPAAVLAGAAIAIANARADMEADRDSGVGSVALRLGDARSWSIHATLLAMVAVVAVASLVAWAAAWPTLIGAVVGTLVVGTGILFGRSVDGSTRELAWELEAVGLAIVAVAWLAGASAAG
jgi:4-hydroxybenzoate polyprenyltransferase